MRYRPELDLILKEISLTIVSIPNSVYLAWVLMFLYLETKRKDWYRWTDGRWEVVGEFPDSSFHLGPSHRRVTVAPRIVPHHRSGVRQNPH